MLFLVQATDDKVQSLRDTVLLMCVNRSDPDYRTEFKAYYYDEQAVEHELGSVKIGVKNMRKRESILEYIPARFTLLEEHFFSLGQEEGYYSNIKELGTAKREEILQALRDVAYDRKHFDKCKNQPVMQRSILRNISSFAANGRLRRMARGDMQLMQYSFSYVLPATELIPEETVLEFNVFPESNPPTNVHVLIGRNGTGKTRLLKSMIASITKGDKSWGRFEYKQDRADLQMGRFANILCVAFSPFDDFSKLGSGKVNIPWSFIGLNKRCSNLNEDIEERFCCSLLNCAEVEWKWKLWQESVGMLMSDPMFQDEAIACFSDYAFIPADTPEAKQERKKKIRQAFSGLSSGHKVVLLIITGCVDKIEEKSILFLDEPENHLHPPLLSALIRALSNLLKKRNGVAIISTHSPVILQEVPRSCVWVLNRFGEYLKAERPGIKTFGASISSLTNHVFGLEATDTGFHRMICEAVDRLSKRSRENDTLQKKREEYDQIIRQFDRQLGDEADLLLWTMLSL